MVFQAWKNKIREVFFISVLIFITSLTFAGKLYAYSKGVHEKISEKVIDKNITKIDGYLKNIGLNNGVSENLNGNNLWIPMVKKAREWIEEGSWKEDIDVGILWSHFYDPRTNKGYSVGGVEIGQSAYDRANDLPNLGPWVWARKRLYDGLTQTDKTIRENYLSIALQSLGRATHLVQDVSVPAHTRNDFHLPYVDEEPYETYTDKHYLDLDYKEIPFPLWDQSISPYAPRQFWDTDTYNGYNPSASLNQGLAEYTNANFFSKDTIFDDAYPFPNELSTDLQSYSNQNQNKLPEIVIAEDNIPDTSFWIKKDKDGEIIDHFVKPGYLTKEALDAGNPIYVRTFTLDDTCYKYYASLLIPRAVGYSAGLLDYFFRGTLEITPPDQIAYAVTDGSQTPYLDTYGHYHQQFTSIKAKVRNSTPDTIPGEEVQNCNQIQGNCIIQAIARYRIIPNYMYDLSNYPPNGTTMHNIEYSYSVSAPIYINSLSSVTPQEFSFDFYTSPIPAGITDLYLQVVFKGTLGNETDIAIAVGMKDLMEPTHQVFWNATDMFQLDAHLRTSYDIRNTPAYAARVDLDHDTVLNETNEGEPYIDPFPMSFGIGYRSVPPEQGGTFYYSAITTVQNGRHIRLITLMDKPQDNYLVLVESDDIYGMSYFYNASPGVVNQEVEGVWQTPTPMITFRYGLDVDGITHIPIRQHHKMALFGCYPQEGIDPYGNPVCSYPEAESIPAELSPSLIDTVYYYSPQTIFFDELTTFGASIANGRRGVVVK